MENYLEIKKNINNYLVANDLNKIRDDLTKTQLNELKELLNHAQKLGDFNNILKKGRSYECYLDEINRKLKTF